MNCQYVSSILKNLNSYLTFILIMLLPKMTTQRIVRQRDTLIPIVVRGNFSGGRNEQ